MKITRLKVMLPYLNDEYKVGKKVNHCNQASSGENERDTVACGIIKEIEADETNNVHIIHFENGSYRMLQDTPVQLDMAELEKSE